MENKVRILIVEDEITSTIFLKRLLQKSDYQVTITYNGMEAMKELELDKYDIILTDWMMPQIDGIELIRRIRENIKPSPYIIMVTALVSEGAKQHALTSGADDYIAKPIEVEELLEKVDLGIKKLANIVDENSVKNIEIHKPNVLPDFVAVGIATSTGGPPTLVELITNFEENSDAAYFIVQHGPPWMIETFTNRLKNETKLKVNLAKSGIKIEKGNVYICPGDYHLIINPNLQLILDDGPKENFVRPSADPLFRSIAHTFNERSIAIVLTGLGRDGSSGASIIKKAGGKVIVQNPETAIAPSMPRAVIEEGTYDFILDVKEIPAKCNNIVSEILK